MPGMEATTDVTLTAAQVAHVACSWEPVATSTVVSVATVPGQVDSERGSHRETRRDRTRAGDCGSRTAGRSRPRRTDPRDAPKPAAGMAQSDLDKALCSSELRTQCSRAGGAPTRLKAIPQQDYDRAIADDELASRRAATGQERCRADRCCGVGETQVSSSSPLRKRWTSCCAISAAAAPCRRTRSKAASQILRSLVIIIGSIITGNPALPRGFPEYDAFAAAGSGSSLGTPPAPSNISWPVARLIPQCCLR